MSSDTIRRAEEPTVLHVSPGAKKIFQSIYRAQSGASKADENISKLQVSEVISKMAFYYEKIRNAVHYNEEHLLRKDAIERILKRQIIIENPIKFSKVDMRASARHLLIELIRAGYLPNNSLPESRISLQHCPLRKCFRSTRVWHVFVKYRCRSKIRSSNC
jgi:hypothetical protein